MDKTYESPDLRLAGTAQDVVLGLNSIGGDMLGEVIIGMMEFADDEAEPAA